MIKYNDKEYVCHIDLAMEFIRGKWKAVILCHLNDKPQRFLQLQRITCGVSQKVLNQKLTEMERDDLITKTIFPEVPPRVEYSLTPLGEKLYEAISPLEKWAVDNLPSQD